MSKKEEQYPNLVTKENANTLLDYIDKQISIAHKSDTVDGMFDDEEESIKKSSYKCRD